jgi:hypothetical protein
MVQVSEALLAESAILGGSSGNPSFIYPLTEELPVLKKLTDARAAKRL